MAEWDYVLGEAWKAMRDLFHDEQATASEHWLSCQDRYRSLLQHVACRSEVTDVLTELMCELSTSHAFVESPEISPSECGSKSRVPASLGAEFEWDSSRGGWRITHIVRGDVWDPSQGGPLARAGLGIQIGDILVALNRRQLSEQKAPEQEMLSLPAGNEVLLTFLNRPRSSPSKENKSEWLAGTNAKKKKKKKQSDSREASKRDWRSPFCGKAESKGPPGTWSRRVRTIEGDDVARYRDWVNSNRGEVHAVSGGRVGYVHIPDMDKLGFAEFYRNFLPESDREALVVDVR